MRNAWAPTATMPGTFETSTPRAPARFNADPRRLFEASGCAGKLILFAVRLDTFENEGETKVFYIGTNDTAELTAIRRHMLAHLPNLPISAEYMHRDAFDVAAKYGKDMFLAIQYLGTDRLPALFALKARFDMLAGRFRFLPRDLSDRLMQASSRLFPSHLPLRLTTYRDRFEHHLMLKVAGPDIEETRRHLASVFPSAGGDFFECTPEEGAKAFLHRFAAAGAAVRYRAMHRDEVEDIVRTRHCPQAERARAGSRFCRTKCRRQFLSRCTTATSSAMSFIRTTSCARGMTRSHWSTGCGNYWTGAAHNTQPSTMSAIFTEPSLR